MSDQKFDGMAFGLLGAILTGVGTFAPFYKAPIVGTSSVMDESVAGGVVLLLAAAIGALSAVRNKGLLTHVAGLVVVAVSGAALAQYFGVLDDIHGKFDRVFLGGVANFILGKVKLSWSIYALFAGGAFLIHGGWIMGRHKARAKRALRLAA